MPKKADKRRQKRRHQHQAVQEARRNETRAVIAERVEAVKEALAELAAVGTDPAVPAADVAVMAVEATSGEGVLHQILGSRRMAESLAGEIVEDAGAARAAELAGALEQHMAGNADLAWFALELAEEAEDLDLAARIGERAFEETGDWDDDEAGLLSAQVASIRWRQGRLGDALAMTHGCCARWPGSDDLMELRAHLIAHTVALSSDDPDLVAFFPYPVDEDQRAAATAALARFTSRDLLYRLRGAVEAFIDADPALSAGRDRQVADFFDQVAQGADLGPLDSSEDTFAMLAAEHYWLHDEAEHPEGQTSVLGLFAADDATPPDLAEAARQWFQHVRYGLWLGDWEGAAGSPRGLWLTDIVTRRRIYASIPAEQIEDVPRWTVLAGALAPVDGVWRSGKSLLALDPALADQAAETVLYNTDSVLMHLFREQGMKPPRRGPDRRRNPPAHGVLSDVLDPMELPEADLAPKVLGATLAQLVAMTEAERHRTPDMRNTDGDPIELISARFPVTDPQQLRATLGRDADFSDDESSGAASGEPAPLTWLGRLMTAEESAQAAGQLRATAEQEGWGPIEESTEPQRWMRGTVHFGPGEVRVEVNSRARFEAISAKLRPLGAGEPTLSRRIDPSMDLAWPGGRILTGRSNGPEADAAWMEHWVTERVPALGGVTPTAAAGHPEKAILLERLLRQFEHDADVVAASGEPPMDVASLREKLGLEHGIYDVVLTDEPTAGE